MKGNLGRLKATQKSGGEVFHFDGESTTIDLCSFWQWSTSDLMSNAIRGMLAEFIVARALGDQVTGVRSEWDAYDLETEDGIKIEVKSSAYLQSWHQEKLSQVSFGILKTKYWSPDTGLYDEESLRQADVYVFAVLAHKDKATADPLNLNQWLFYVLPTTVFNERRSDQKTITLGSLEKLCESPLTFSKLQEGVLRAYSESLSLE